ncbi:MAG: hypothetical protein CFE43_15355 [Burkholderiales bacterium PBB3]|nr:MAG: hypothetical protein CFE43_15355 [Burkholderiales bacterium PBB3]
MNIARTTAVQAATSAAASATSDAVHILVLKKALNTQAAAAATLIQALPPVPPLASAGSLGTRINTFA